jgi:hypothetical protein
MMRLHGRAPLIQIRAYVRSVRIQRGMLANAAIIPAGK